MRREMNSRILEKSLSGVVRKVDGGQKIELASTTHDAEIYTQPFDAVKTFMWE
jgi:hypothetical protein